MNNEIDKNLNNPLSKTQNFSDNLMKDMILAESNPEVTSDNGYSNFNDRRESENNNDYGMNEIVNDKQSNSIHNNDPLPKNSIHKDEIVEEYSMEEENQNSSSKRIIESHIAEPEKVHAQHNEKYDKMDQQAFELPDDSDQ